METENINTSIKNSSWKGEEIANSITHGVGAGLSIAALVILVVFASLRGDAWRIVSFSIYGTTLIILYLVSTLYHGFTNAKLKQFFKILDHSAIYLLIAGTYTAVTLVSMRGPWGWSLFGVIWGMALIGITVKIIIPGHSMVFSVITYIIMGWLIIIALKPMIQMVPEGLFIWLAIGGLCYTFGVLFFALDKIPYNHAIWHLFVLGGSTSHFFGILFYLT